MSRRTAADICQYAIALQSAGALNADAIREFAGNDGKLMERAVIDWHRRWPHWEAGLPHKGWEDTPAAQKWFAIRTALRQALWGCPDPETPVVFVDYGESSG